jgi:hypothetical protein
MGDVVERKESCAHCGAELAPGHIGTCPSCGKEGRNISLTLHDTISVTTSLSWETRKEYYQKHKGALGTVVAITLLSPFLGLVLVDPVGVVVGLALGGLAYYLGPKAIMKVVEITKGPA